MSLRTTRSALRLAVALLAAAIVAPHPAPAADDGLPPILGCVDGVLARMVPHAGGRGRLRLRRVQCDVDGRADGACTFGRRCRPCVGCAGIRVRCRSTVSVPVGETRGDGRLSLACVAQEGRTPCGPDLTCDTATELCVARQPIGPAIVRTCEPVPAGCGADRTCACAAAALCRGPFGTCTDEAPNAITCTCPRCQ
jgi:hypothetical protein